MKSRRRKWKNEKSETICYIYIIIITIYHYKLLNYITHIYTHTSATTWCGTIPVASYVTLTLHHDRFIIIL